MKFIAFCSLLGIFVGLAVNSTLGNFVQRPENETVYLGSVASFTCQIDLGDYNGIFWYVTEANTPHYVLPAEYGAVARTYELTNNILSSTLTINARETTNNTRVLCKGDRASGQDIFNTAYMTIQGLTAAPINITVTITNNGFNLTWTPPFTLPGTEMNFIVEAMINSLLKLLTSQTYQYFSCSDLNISHCDSNQTAHFTVRGINEVGEGEPASITLHLTPAENMYEELEGPPTNFTASVLDNSLFLMWMPPLSSLWEVPILYYAIDVFDAYQAFLLERANTSNLSYSFNYSVLGINRCFNSYGIRVNIRGISFNGEGNISTLLVNVTQNDRYCITNTTISEVTPTTDSNSTLENYLLQDQNHYILVIVSVGVVLVILLTTTTLSVGCLMKRKSKLRGLKISYAIDHNTAYGHVTGKDDHQQQPHFYEKSGPSAEPIYEVVAEISIPAKLNCHAV